MPQIPIVESACGCCSVFVGARVLAWLDIVFPILQIIGSFSYSPAPGTGNPDMDRQNSYENFTRSPMFVIPTSLIVIAVAIILLIGLQKRNASYLLPHLIVRGISIAFLGLMVVIFIIMSFVVHMSMLIGALILAAVAALCIYFWLWVYAVYTEFKESNNRAPKYEAPGGQV